MTTISPDAASVPVSRPRRIGFAVLALLLAAFTGLVMGGASALVAGFVATGEDVIHRIHFNHWGALMAIMTAAPLVAVARRPSIAPARQVAVLAAVGVSVAAGAWSPTDRQRQ